MTPIPNNMALYDPGGYKQISRFYQGRSATKFNLDISHAFTDCLAVWREPDADRLVEEGRRQKAGGSKVKIASCCLLSIYC